MAKHTVLERSTEWCFGLDEREKDTLEDLHKSISVKDAIGPKLETRLIRV